MLGPWVVHTRDISVFRIRHLPLCVCVCVDEEEKIVKRENKINKNNQTNDSNQICLYFLYVSLGRIFFSRRSIDARAHSISGTTKTESSFWFILFHKTNDGNVLFSTFTLKTRDDDDDDNGEEKKTKRTINTENISWECLFKPAPDRVELKSAIPFSYLWSERGKKMCRVLRFGVLLLP